MRQAPGVFLEGAEHPSSVGLRPARAGALAVLLFALAVATAASADGATALRFTEVAAQSGIDHVHGYTGHGLTMMRSIAAGAACADFDRDGWLDLFVVCGAAGPHRLYRNLGNGRFQDVAAAQGIALADSLASGPLFFDYDGDGWPDLFIGAIEGGAHHLFHNEHGTGFVDATVASGIDPATSIMSATAGDFDHDGRLDLFLGHWGSAAGPCHLWRNVGAGRFECVDASTGLSGLVQGPTDFTFTTHFADLNGDERPDLLVSSDFGSSRILLQGADGRFSDAGLGVVSDENGMGAAVGDIDGDGDLDWFVSSVWDPDGVAEGDWGMSGNRLYRNLGDGQFEDATDAAGVRQGYWGWGATFADFDRDGDLDLFHVNGWPQGSPEFRSDPSRLYLGDGHGAFQEASAACGLVDIGQGRGVIAFDYDRDGDVDLFVANHGGSPMLWRNDGASGHWLEVVLEAGAPNVAGIGARLELVTHDTRQVRVIEAGSNFVSQDPAEVHFGFAATDEVVALNVRWPDGTRSSLGSIPPNQRIVLTEAALRTTPGAPPEGRPTPFSSSVELQLAERASLGSRLQVLDVRGRTVRSLDIVPGQRSVHWDGRDADGVPLGAGLYWVRDMSGRMAPARLVLIR